MISNELTKKMVNNGIDPLNVMSITTKNNKKKRLIITEIILIDGSKYELIDDFIYYAARKNKRW